MGGIYVLDQDRLIGTLHDLWCNESATLGAHANEKIRLFGIIMSLKQNRPQFQ